jgi:hypothetical protein
MTPRRRSHSSSRRSFMGKRYRERGREREGGKERGRGKDTEGRKEKKGEKRDGEV